jgi:hypothetical protein
MGKNVIPFQSRKASTDSEKAASPGSRIIVRVGRQRYALDITCQAGVLPPEPEPASRLVETKFLRLRKPVGWGNASAAGEYAGLVAGIAGRYSSS